MKLSGETANLEIDYTNTFIAGTTQQIDIIRNVNMRQLLGEMYDKYKKFYIVFTGIAGNSTTGNLTYSAGAITGMSNAAGWLLRMSGLDFVNNTIDGSITRLPLFPLGFAMPFNGYTTGASTSTQNGIVFNKEMNDNTTLIFTPVLNKNLQPCVGSQVTTSGILSLTLNFSIYGLE